MTAFKGTITSVLRECDGDFVKYIAGRAGIQRTFTAKFVEAAQPIMKRALTQAISDMVTSSLSTPAADELPPPAQDTSNPKTPDPDAPVVDANNSRIITTSAERKLLEACQDVLQGEDLQGKDTESYFTVLYQGKTNRWLLRYWAEKKQPSVTFCMPLTAEHRAEIKRAKLELGNNDTLNLNRPEQLVRLPGLLDDALAFCKNDENFKRGGSAS